MPKSGHFYWGVGVAGVGIILLVYLGSARLSKIFRPNRESSSKTKIHSSNATEIIATEESPSFGKTPSSPQPSRVVKTYSKAIELGLSEIPSRPLGNMRRFMASVSLVDGSCQTGDGDLLKAASKNMMQKKWLFTVESLSHPDNVLSKKLLSLAEIAENSEFDVSLPRDNTDDLALFFCQDSTNQGSCRKKSNLDQKDWKAVAKSGNLPDRLIYFQLLSQKKNGIYLIPSAKWDKASLLSLTEHLEPWLLTPASSLEKMRQYLEALRPMPAKVRPRGLQIPLPTRSRGC